MANEYLIRTPTSTGNRKVWTFSCWIKINNIAGTPRMIFAAGQDTNNRSILYFGSSIGTIDFYQNSGGVAKAQVTQNDNRRDFSSWMHILAYNDTTKTNSYDGIKIFVNGIQSSNDTLSTYTKNFDTWVNSTNIHTIGAQFTSGSFPLLGELTDVFLVDGQALTPDVFGFYKQGKGYISVGSTQATDFRPGQWVPKTPRVIKTEINRRGGFGVNGFYLPMNDSKNFGADFHGEPNSIITLNEKLPQPRVGVATTASVGLGYTDALRADPYAANLVLALPFVSGGLSSGFGDYAPSIKGSGSAKSITNTGVSIANTASYYGSGSYFDSGNYLSTPNVSDFQFGTGDFTMESWVYSFSGSWSIIAAQGTTGDAGRTLFGVSNTGAINTQIGSQSLSSSAGIATSGQWNHCAWVRKNGVGTIYLNGVAVGINTVYTNSIQNTTLYVGSDQGWSNTSSKMYLQDLRVYKGVAKYTGGFDVPRPYTPVGIATWRAVPDTTANNFATLNPLKKTTGTVTFSNGNLTSVGDRSIANYCTFSTVGFSTGKWYAEIRQDAKSGAAANILGVVSINLTNSSGISSYQHYYYGYSLNANRVTNITPSTTTNPFQDAGGTYAYDNGDLISIAADITNNKVYFAKNGVWLHTGTTTFSTSGSYDTSIPSGIEWSFGEPAGGGTGYTNSWNFGQNPTFSGNTTAGTFTDSNSKGLFKYQPPTGFLALCEDNLPTPAISDPGKHFKTVLWTGDGNSGRSIVGVGFTPDLVWVKNRTVGGVSHLLYDVVRGVGSGKALSSNLTDSEGISTLYGTDAGYGYLTGLSYDGFSVNSGSTNANYVNQSPNTYVAWCWRAGAGTTSTNTNGSITSVVSVNQDAGFSIVSWTGNNAATATVGHGLGKVPAFVILKARDTTGDNNWVIFHKSMGSSTFDKYMYLTTGSSGTLVPSLPANSNIFTVSNPSINSNNIRYITYCWAEIEGFSKFGSYVGNGSADGPFVYCGFKPAFVLTKNATTVGTNWLLWDSSRNSNNPSNFYQIPNNNLVDQDTGADIDFLSNGFKVRNTSTSGNGSGATIIFAAFAESPFQTANSK